MFGIDVAGVVGTVGLTLGYLILFGIIFAESGLFFGFFFPGDSLLLTAGLLAARPVPVPIGKVLGHQIGVEVLLQVGLLGNRPPAVAGTPLLDIYLLIPLLFVGAVLGDTVGYWFGAKTGPLLFKRPKSLFFRPEYLQKAQVFYEKHGGKTITLARFLPVIRTFAPIVAGAARMKYGRFLAYNLVGGLAWAVGVTMLGYALGRIFGQLQGIDHYFTLLVLAFFFIPGLPTLIHLWRDRRKDLFDWAKRVLLRRPAPETPGQQQ